MPYTKPPKGKTEKWMKIWNGTYEGYINSGKSPKEAERLAFMTANSKVKSKSKGKKK